MKKDQEIRLLRNEIDAMKEENDKNLAKKKALEIYLSELQRNLDEINFKCQENQAFVEEMKTQDWTKKIQEYNEEITHLRKILLNKENEISDLKKDIVHYFKNSDYNQK